MGSDEDISSARRLKKTKTDEMPTKKTTKKKTKAEALPRPSKPVTRDPREEISGSMKKSKTEVMEKKKSTIKTVTPASREEISSKPVTRSKTNEILSSKPDQMRLLSENITCDDSALNRLTPETIALANIVVERIKKDEIGLLVQISNQAALHLALGLLDSPVVQRKNADESVRAFRGWLIDQASDVRNKILGDSDTSLALHHLSARAAHDVALRQWYRFRWISQLQENRKLPDVPARIEHFADVFWIEGTREHRAELSILFDILG